MKGQQDSSITTQMLGSKAKIENEEYRGKSHQDKVFIVQS